MDVINKINQVMTGVIPMSVKRRILALQLAEKIQQNPEYAKKIGVSVEVKHQQIKDQNYKEVDEVTVALTNE